MASPRRSPCPRSCAPSPRSWLSRCSRAAVARWTTSRSRPSRCPSPAARARRTAATWRAPPRGVVACASRPPVRARSPPTNQSNRRRSSVSIEQRETLDAVLRQSAFPADSDVGEQRRLLRELTSAQPLPADVTVTDGPLGTVPVAEITVAGTDPRRVVLYFHGGVYVLGDAFQAAG